jgi:hypothetical protein
MLPCPAPTTALPLSPPLRHRRNARPHYTLPRTTAASATSTISSPWAPTSTRRIIRCPHRFLHPPRNRKRVCCSHILDLGGPSPSRPGALVWSRPLRLCFSPADMVPHRPIRNPPSSALTAPSPFRGATRVCGAAHPGLSSPPPLLYLIARSEHGRFCLNPDPAIDPFPQFGPAATTSPAHIIEARQDGIKDKMGDGSCLPTAAHHHALPVSQPQTLARRDHTAAHHVLHFCPSRSPHARPSPPAVPPSPSTLTPCPSPYPQAPRAGMSAGPRARASQGRPRPAPQCNISLWLLQTGDGELWPPLVRALPYHVFQPPTAPGTQGKTPLHVTYSNQRVTAKLLIEKGAKPKAEFRVRVQPSAAWPQLRFSQRPCTRTRTLPRSRQQPPTRNPPTHTSRPSSHLPHERKSQGLH